MTFSAITSGGVRVTLAIFVLIVGARIVVIIIIVIVWIWRSSHAREKT
jgi:hypothetical protein